VQCVNAIMILKLYNSYYLYSNRCFNPIEKFNIEITFYNDNNNNNESKKKECYCYQEGTNIVEIKFDKF